MIYLKNNTEIQAIYIPRQTVLGSGYIPNTKAYEKGYRDGLENGKEQQKEKLSNLYVTENGQYEREDGWNVVTVDVPDLNGSYDEGKIDGINEQKSKLESISITENGTYNKEDGYNHIEVNVPDLNGSYDQGQADMAAKARVLNVTENGTYLSKFSDPIVPTTVTGVYADGTEFYDYAQLNGKVFNTNIPATSTTRLELWYKGDNTLAGDAWNIIIGAEKNPDYNCYQIRYYMYSNSDLIFELGRNNLRYTWDENAWHHILIAKETENASSMSLWVDEVKIGDFGNTPFNPQSPFYINCIESLTDLTRNANGYFGMIKIDDTIIIPTANGFKNVNTGVLLEVVKDGTYTFTENLPIYGEGELYKTINVNVPDLNGSYDEGKTDGINEQKSKLETIEITVNGTYNRGDGYNKVIVKVPDLNGSYDEGYEQGHTEGYAEGERIGYGQGQADIATNAIVLNVTENGVYKTKFSDPIMPTLVTGVYADGTEFYDYAELGNKVYNTNITVTQDSVIELWYKGDNAKTNDGWNTIFGCAKRGDEDFWMGYFSNSNTTLNACLGQKRLQFSWDDNVWHHIIMKNDGLRIDDVLIGSFNTTKTFAYKLGLNSDGDSFIRNANGCYGMIKIDNTIIIPTADGFLNTNTGELLEVVKNGVYTFTENLPIYAEGELYKTINVNVPTAQEQSFNYDITAFTYKVYNWTSVNINRDNITNDCGHRPLDCLLFRNRSGECTVMTKIDTCSGVVRLENGWNSDNVILSLKSNTITNFSSNSINSNQLTSIDTGFARLEGNAIMNCNALTDIKVTVLNDNLSTQFATNCFNGLPAEGTITIGKNVDVTITNDEIISFFRTIVGEGWTITIK